ncbi:MAG: cobyrinic acid a,c-diamide synthase [Bacteroidota bacterium]|nr:cobyrinic acid a,c-diamide synthase [Bacteroidota bacterium]
MAKYKYLLSIKIMSSYPRVTIAGLSGDSGKTFLTCGILSVLKAKGYSLAVFKKGPDYIDPAWLKIASETETRNLDTFLMGNDNILNSFTKNASGKDISVIEGNRGLFDGFDIQGSHSTAELAKLLKSPLILILNITKLTRTAAALVLGCKVLDKDLNIAGIILNHVAGKRHERTAKDAIENETGIPVIGSIPKLGAKDILPSRHLGLITPGEYSSAEKAIGIVKSAINDYVEIDKIIEIAISAPELQYQQLIEKNIIKKNVKIGYFCDKIFSFYYPENLEALESKGAELLKISSIEDSCLPELDCLYIGGGFPESNIEELVNNRLLMQSVKYAAVNGLPIYAECGGLIYLCDSIEIDNNEYPLAGVFPLKIKMNQRPQGHGYCEAFVARANPFYKVGAFLKGHEFHYSRIIENDNKFDTCLDITRGTGAINGRDGLIYKNVFASYLHLHALGCPDWAEGMIGVISYNSLICF